MSEFKKFYENKSAIDNIENAELNEEVLKLNEAGGLSIMNGLLKLVGSQKRQVYPELYPATYIINVNMHGKVMNLFMEHVINWKMKQKKPNQKLWVKEVYQGIVNQKRLQKLQYGKTAVELLFMGIPGDWSKQDAIKFWQPVDKVNVCTIYVTNRSWLSKGDIVLWDVQTKADFKDLGDAEEIKAWEALGWEAGANQYLISTNAKGAKFWTHLTGAPINAWVKLAKTGQLTGGNPYAVLGKELADLQKQKPKGEEETKTQEISKDEYDKLVPESVQFESEELTEESKQVKKVGDSWVAVKGNPPYNYSENGFNPKHKYVAVNDKGEEDTKLQNKLDYEIERLKGEKEAEKPEDKPAEDKGTATDTGTAPEASTDKPAEEPKKEEPPVTQGTKITDVLKDELDGGADKLDPTEKTAAGWWMQLKNGGKVYLYTTKDGKYKIGYDKKSEPVLIAKKLIKREAPKSPE